MKKIYLSLAAMLFVGINANSQQQESTTVRNCATMDYYQEQKMLHPEIELNKNKIEEFTQQWIENNPTQKNKTTSVITIPVVVHVVYNSSTQNINDAQIQSQITVLNEDYSKTNADFSSVVPTEFSTIAGSMGIQFCLASVDPNGNATTGIVRKQTNKTSFSTNDYVKYSSKGGDDAWPSSSYLNIWVCKISGGIIGYAQFPGGAAATDGVVIDYRYFGNQGTATAPYNLGRTASHEVGHWLNLYHIWGDDNGSCSGTDNVADTPNQSNYNFGCPNYPKSDNCSSSQMFMNFMDYTDDACMAMFSAGQVSRSQALFASGGARESLLSSLGCGGSVPVDTVDTTSTPSVTYCASYSTNSKPTWIKSISLNSYTNTSNNNSGYGDYTSSSISLVPGGTYTISLEPGFANKSINEYWNVWMDYNQDGDFEDAGEKVGNVSSKTTVSLSFNVPSTATGSTRMRIAMKPQSYTTTSCDVFSGGEVEDYTVNFSSDGSREMNSLYEIELDVFPNPAKDNVSIAVDLDEANPSTATIQLIDLQGKQFYTSAINGSGVVNQTIALAHIPAGIYIISVSSAQGIAYRKLVVSK